MQYHTNVNDWSWLYIFLIPLIVFSAKPKVTPWIRILRLLFAIVGCCLLMNLSEHLHYNIKRQAYNACQNQFPDGLIQHHEECPQPGNSGANFAFYMILGWIPATGYVGFWEVLWRLYYRHEIKNLGRNFKGKWLSNTIIGFFIFCLIYSIATLVAVIYTLYFWEK